MVWHARTHTYARTCTHAHLLHRLCWDAKEKLVIFSQHLAVLDDLQVGVGGMGGGAGGV